MHTVKAMERRFEKEDENMTQMPEQEEAIFVKLGDENSHTLAAASYPFVDLPSGDTLRCKLFPADKFYKISLYFDGRIKYNEVND